MHIFNISQFKRMRRYASLCDSAIHLYQSDHWRGRGYFGLFPALPSLPLDGLPSRSVREESKKRRTRQRQRTKERKSERENEREQTRSENRCMERGRAREKCSQNKINIEEGRRRTSKRERESCKVPCWQNRFYFLLCYFKFIFLRQCKTFRTE